VNFPHRPFPALFLLTVALLASPRDICAQVPEPKNSTRTAQLPGKQSTPAPQELEQQELQKAIDEAGSDRASIVRNLEGFLNNHPESSQRPQIYRAIVESSLQLQDYTRATNYAERLVSLKPEDISLTVLAIQLLEQNGDAAGWKRAISYCTRVIEEVERASEAQKSPRVSPEEWEAQKKRDRSSVLLMRGRLYRKLNDWSAAQKDFASAYAILPSATAAERLGELAELRKDSNTAILEYARAFSLADGATSRRELRKKLGNAWRLAHGSEDGLGDYLLHAFDDASAEAAPAKRLHNQGVNDIYGFTVRKVADGSPLAFSSLKDKVVVLNFWTTWCGPCREMEPHFEKIAAQFARETNVQFYAVNCDDDETLVAPYLSEEKPTTATLFSDGLDRFLRVDSFPTTVILDRTGKIAFRTDGFDPDTIEKSLSEAITRTLH
jgi:thiol-disulfide isomerase/thioredoxin